MRRRSGTRRSHPARLTFLFLVLLAVPLWPTAVEAQRRGQRDPGQQEELMGQTREVLEARLRSFFGRAVKTRLDLSDAEMEEVQAIFRTFAAERQELAREEQVLRRSLGPALRETREDLSEAEAREVLNHLVALRVREAQIFRQEQEALLEILTPTEVVRLYQLREAFANRIMQMRGRGPGRPGGGGPPGGPGRFFDRP